MDLSKISNSRLRNVYGLPTFRGLVLFGILGAALWFSFTNNSSVERWLFFLMLLLVLVHLMDVGRAFRALDFKAVSFDPPFEGESCLIPIQINNSSDLDVEKIHLRFHRKMDWVEIGPIAGKLQVVAFLPYQFSASGLQATPKLTVRHIPSPKFFRLWKVFKFKEMIHVLPKPVDHHVVARPQSQAHDDHELKDLDPIRDLRLLPLADQKLLLKTGLPYRKVYHSDQSDVQVELNWENLELLSPREKTEQFSYWIKLFSEEKASGNLTVSVKTPFMETSNLSGTMNWRTLKSLFAKWLYAQS